MGGRGRGRGWYYKEKYAGGRGQPRNDDRSGKQPDNPTTDTPNTVHSDDDQSFDASSTRTGTFHHLSSALHRIDGKGYKAYRDVEGTWTFPDFTLFIDHVQGDPYAAPSRLRILIPASTAAVPPSLTTTKTRRIAVCDYLTRTFGQAVSSSGGDVRAQSGGWSGEKGGDMMVDSPGQHVLERSSIILHPPSSSTININTQSYSVEARFTVALPARGRTVLGSWAETILITNLPRYIQQGLFYRSLDPAQLAHHVACVEDTEVLRSMLPSLGLISFIGDGSMLPRASGASDAPMSSTEAVRFISPPSLAVTVTLPNAGTIRGMGIRKGITMIVGGGFHGKSTLLNAIELGVYNKVPGDGREFVATDPSAVKIRAEDGRNVAAVDISPFISNLPFQRDTICFNTLDASGSTSQAANIQEALEAGSETILLDEDTCATNFMFRDARMAALIPSSKEPITPLLRRIVGLKRRGVSCVLVMGGSGQYFEVADTVICLDEYLPSDLTQQAQQVAVAFNQAEQAHHSLLLNYTNNNNNNNNNNNGDIYRDPVARVIASIHPKQQGDIKVKTRTRHAITLDTTDLELQALEQLVEVSQTRAVGESLLCIQRKLSNGNGGNGKVLIMRDVLDELEADMEVKGLDALTRGGQRYGNLARPRKFEIAGAVNRLRCATIRQEAVKEG
jgi:predicted ABC-class ATPase